MKYLRKQNLSSTNVQDHTLLREADGNLQFNPAHRVVLNGDLQINGDLTLPPGASIPGPEVTNVMYVTLDGNDHNSGFGEGPSQAKRSIKSAVDAAQQGTTIFVHSGEYFEFNPIRIPPKVSIVGDNLRRVIVRPLNGPETYDIVSVERSNQVTTITTSAPHGLKVEDRIRVRAVLGNENTVDETDVNITATPSPTAVSFRQAGANLPFQLAGGVIKWAPDLFLVNSQDYITGIVIKGLQAPAYCFNIDDDAIVDTSPYVQNCSNINGPWMRNGEEWLPFITEQSDLNGNLITGPRPLLDHEIDPLQLSVYGIDTEGGGGGMLIDGDRYSDQSPIKSMVGDAFTQVAQGGVGFHVTNFGYMQLVSCFSVFCSKGFFTSRGGYLSISNSVIDFGDEGFVSDGFYLDPYAQGKVAPDFYSTVGSITVNTEGSGFSSPPTIVIEPPDLTIAGSRVATAEANIDPILGVVNGIAVIDPGFGYTFQPSIEIVPANGATATANLSKNLAIDLVEVSNKPQVGSIMFLGDDPTGYYISGTQSANQPFKYDEQRYRRDIESIVEAVVADMVLGTNYRSIQAGQAYLRSYSSKIISSQKTETLAALEQAKMLTLAVATDTTAKDIIAENFDIVIAILDNGLIAVPELIISVPDNADPGFPEAAAILQANKTFIQDEIVSWLNQEYSFNYNEQEFSNDIGVILDAVLSDLVFGTNYKSRLTAFSYVISYSSADLIQQKEQIIAGINRSRDIAATLISDPAAIQTIKDNYKIITDVIFDINPARAPGLVYTNPINTDVGILDGAAQVKVNRDFLIAEIVSYVNDSLNLLEISDYKKDIYTRDTGFVVDAVVHDLLYGGNTSVITVATLLFFDNANDVNNLIAERISAYTHLKTVLAYVIEANTAWTPSFSNILTQDVSGPAGSTVSLTAVSTLMQTFIDIIAVEPLTINEAVVEPTHSNGANFSFRNDSRLAILSETATIQAKTIKFLNETYSANFSYNQSTCRRDVGYIIDAIRYDLIYGGNSQTREAGLSYADGSVIAGQVEQTQAAYEHWREITADIVKNILIIPTEGNITQQDVGILTGSPADPNAPAAKIVKLLKIIIDVIDHGTGYVPEIPTDPEYDIYGDGFLLTERALVIVAIPSIQDATIEFINTTFSGPVTVSVFPPVQSAVNGVIAKFHNVSTLSSGGTALEYVGAGVTYNALPFFGGEPIPEKERVETNNGKAFTVSSDQVGNYRIGEFFSVNALTGEVTINAENLNLSGLASIGPFKRNGIPVGVQLREVSDNSGMISSTGLTDGNTVPTQTAVVNFVDSRYLNKIQSSTPQTVESDVIFKKNVEVQGGNLTTDQSSFNLLNTLATTVNFAGDATTVSIGSTVGSTTVNNDLEVFGDVTIHGADDSSTGYLDTAALTFNLLDRTVTTINFGGDATEIVVGNTASIVQINNDINVTGDLTTDQTTFNLLNTTADTINFGSAASLINIGSTTVSIEVANDLNVANDLTVLGNTVLGNELTDTTEINGILSVNLNDNIISALEISELDNSYLKLDTTNSFELISFGSLPLVTILNATDAVTNSSGALTVEGGVSVKKNVYVGTNLFVDGNARLGNERNVDSTEVSGTVNINVPDNTINVFEIRENLSSYVKVITTDLAEFVEFGTTPTVKVLNTTNSTSKDTGALIISGGVGVGLDLTVGVDVTVNRDVIVDRNLAVNGQNLTTTNLTFNLVNTGATAVNFAGAATAIEIGSATGTTSVNNNLEVDGDVAVGGGDLTVSTSTFNLANTVAETVNIAGAATTVEIGSSIGNTTVNNNLVVDLDLEILGGNITTDQLLFNLINTAATTVNIAGAASAVNIGSTIGTTTVNHNLDVDGDVAINGGDLTSDQTAFNLLSTGTLTVNAFTAATLISIGSASGTTTVNNDLVVSGNVTLGNEATDLITVTGGLTVNLADNQAGVFRLLENTNEYFKIDTSNSAELITLGATPKISILNTTDATNEITASVVLAGGLATAKQLWVGTNLFVNGNSRLGDNRVSDTTTVNGVVSIDIPDDTGSAFEIKENLSSYVKVVTTNLLESVEFGAIPKVIIQNTTDSTTKDTGALIVEGGVGVEFNLVTGLDVTAGRNVVATNNLAVNGGNLTTSAAAFSLVNTNATTVNFAGTATTIILGAATGSTTVRNNLTVDLDLEVKGGDLTTNQSTFNLINTSATAVNFAGAGTAVVVGAATGDTTVRNNLTVDLDLAVKGGNLTTNQLAFNLLDTTATTVNFAGAATLIDIGATTGTTSINNNLDVDGNINVDGGSITTNQLSIDVLNTTATTINAFGSAGVVSLGAVSSTVTLNGTTESINKDTGALVVDGGVGIEKNLNVGGDVGVAGQIELTGDISANAFNSSKLALQAPTNDSTVGERLRLYDFNSLVKPNYAIGVEARHIWHGVDVHNNDLGFKWYGGTVEVMRVSGTGNLSLVGNAVIDGDVAVNGGDLTTTASTFNLVDTTATTVNFAGAATAVEIGAATGTTNVNNNLHVDGDFRLGSSVVLFNQGENGFSVRDDFDMAGVSSQTGYTFSSGAGRTSTILALGVTGEFNNYVGVTGTALSNKFVIGSTGTNTTFEIRNDSGAVPVNMSTGSLLLSVNSVGDVSITGDLEVKGGDITTTQTAFNLVNTTAAAVNFAGAATAVEIGSATGTTNVNNNLVVDLDVEIRGSDLTTNQLTFNLVDTTATTVNFAGAATSLTVGASSGSTTIRTADVILDGDVAVNGGDLTTTASTFNLVDTTATTVNFAGAATAVEIGAATGTTNVNNNLIVDLDVEIRGGDLTTDQSLFNLVNTTATTVNFAGAATVVSVGAVTGTTTVNNNLTVAADLAVNGGDLTTDQLIFNLLNTTATTVNFAGFAETLVMGSPTSTSTFNNNLVVAGNLTVSGTTTIIDTEQIRLADNIITLNSNYVGSTPTESAGIEIERGDLAKPTILWDELNDRWTLDNATGTSHIIHHTGRDVELGVETSGNYVATIAGTINQVTVANSGTETAAIVLSLPQDIHAGASPEFVNTTLTGDLSVNGGDITTTFATFNLINANATTVNFAGAATSIDIGAATGTVTIRNTSTVFDSSSHIIIPVGNVAQRPAVPAEGMVRYNTELQTFEGYTSAWGSLGGVKDIDGDTFIIPELSPGSDEDILYFHNGGVNTAQLTATRLMLLHNTASTNTTSGSLVVTGGAGISQNVHIGGTLNTTGDATLSSTLAVTGNTTVTGNLAVNGGDITSTAVTVNLANANATTVNFAGAATTVEIGSSAGTTNINHNLVVDLDVEIRGGDLTTDQTTFNLLPTTATTGNVLDVATAVNVAKSAASASTLTVGPLLSGNGILLNGTSTGVVSVDSIVSTGTVNLFAGITTGTVNIATTNGCTVNIGGSGSTTNVAELVLITDLAVAHGGTGRSTFTEKGVVYGAGTDGLLVTAASNPGVSNAATSFGILTTDATNVPVWTDTIDEGEY